MKKSIDSMGYYIVYMPSHHKARSSGVVYEHVLVAERKLGRKLKDGEVVHHEDENRLNNSIDNIFVFKSQSDHARYHQTGKRTLVGDYYISPPLSRECLICGKIFEYRPSDSTKHCSSKCSGISRRKTSRPSKEELSTLIQSKSLLQIGKDYGVSDNAVRKWLISYDLPYKRADIVRYKLDKSKK